MKDSSKDWLTEFENISRECRKKGVTYGKYVAADGKVKSQKVKPQDDHWLPKVIKVKCKRSYCK